MRPALWYRRVCVFGATLEWASGVCKPAAATHRARSYCSDQAFHMMERLDSDVSSVHAARPVSAQYFDSVRDVSNASKSSTLFMSHSPAAVNKVRLVPVGWGVT